MRRQGSPWDDEYVRDEYVRRELQENRRFREFMYRWFEAFVFVVVFLGGSLSLYFAYRTDSTFWQTFLLSLAANLIVFVLLFWIFQYFLGRQPGSEVINDFPYRNALIIDQNAEMTESSHVSPEYASHRKARQRQRS
jgi:hypothetical protein